MGTVEALWDPFTVDDQKPSRRIPILVYNNTPRKYIVVLGSKEIKGTHLTSGSTRPWRGFFNVKGKKEVLYSDIFSFNLIQNDWGYKEFEGIWGKLHGMKARADRNCRIRWWMGRRIASMCFLPRIRRFSSFRPEGFLFSASWGVRSLIWILSGIL